MKTLFLLLFCLILCACTESGENANAQRAAKETEVRTKDFAKFQDYANKHYPKWVVTGYRANVAQVLSEADIDNAYYAVLIANNNEEKELILKESNFTATDGATVSRFQEINKDEFNQMILHKPKEKTEERNAPDPD
jgi:hypothetical protein